MRTIKQVLMGRDSLADSIIDDTQCALQEYLSVGDVDGAGLSGRTNLLDCHW